MGLLTWIEFGDEHIGNFKNEAPHGEGMRIIYSKEGIREFTRFGSWKNGKEHGKGFVIDEISKIMWHDEYNNGERVSN
jgi:hypothetical protein